MLPRWQEMPLIEPELEDHNYHHKEKGRTVCDYYGKFMYQDPEYEPQQYSNGK